MLAQSKFAAQGDKFSGQCRMSDETLSRIRVSGYAETFDGPRELISSMTLMEIRSLEIDLNRKKCAYNKCSFSMRQRREFHLRLMCICFERKRK